MKFACIDRTAPERLRLYKLFEESLESCRDTVGHLATLELVPMSREELLLALSSPESSKHRPETAIIGPGHTIDESVALAAAIREESPDLPLIVVLQGDLLTLRALRRFERFEAEVLQLGDSPTRFAHALVRHTTRKRNTRSGKLITVSGVKGGVGATSIVAGLAHAAQTAGKSSVVYDLSNSNSIAHYLGASRRHSSDYRVLLTDHLAPNRSTIERSIVKTPNGVEILLPPSGGSEVRELWLRNSDTLDINLAALEILCEMYDTVFVDLAQAEGLLPFALQAKADLRLLVSSNDPSSVHLLADRFSTLASIPSPGPVHLVLTMLAERSLTESDVYDFLFQSEVYRELAPKHHVVKRDARAAQWIGTGNTLYTEGSHGIQIELERIISAIFGGVTSVSEKRESVIHSFFRRLLPRTRKQPTDGVRLLADRTSTDTAFILGTDFSEPHLSPLESKELLYEPPRPIKPQAQQAGRELRVVGSAR